MNSISPFLRQVSREDDQTSQCFTKPIPRELAFTLLQDLLRRLRPVSSQGLRYLAFGSVARALLCPEGQTSFKDIDILTIRPLDTAIKEVSQTLEAMHIEHHHDDNGNFFFCVKDAYHQLQLVDPVDGKKAFPGDFICFKDSEFDASRCVQCAQTENGPPIPCVPQQFLNTRGKTFRYLDDPKTGLLTEKKLDGEVSEFKL